VTGRDYVGGIIGTQGGTLTQSYNMMSISGSATGTGAGGLVGFIWAPSGGGISVQNSYSTGSINGGTGAGGILGYIGNGGAGAAYLVSKVYSTGTVNGVDGAGGIVGTIDNTTVTISQSYSLSEITGTTHLTGITYVKSGPAVVGSNIYWRKGGTFNSSITDSNAGVTSLTDAAMQIQGNYTGFDFVTLPVWKMAPAISNYPVLNWQ
jgi:hypothetical protein